MTSNDVTTIQEWCVVQVFTLKKFHRPDDPKKCSSKGYYHVWRWRGGPKAPTGTGCQCGLFNERLDGKKVTD